MSEQLLSASPYLYYPDGAVAVAWLTRVFGFSEIVRYVTENGDVQEAELAAGSSVIMIAGGREASAEEGRGLLLIVHVADVFVQHKRVTQAGVTVDPPREKPWGPITFNVRDPWGYNWDFWQKHKPFLSGTGGLREIRA